MDLCEAGQMTPEEEQSHWWIRTRFHYLDKSLERLPGPMRVIEVGCGTAQNLRHLREHSTLSGKISRLIGLEPGIPVDVLRDGWMGPEDAIHRTQASIEGRFDALVAMDVIEHVEDDVGTLREWLRLVKPGGTVFITVPAFAGLWSRHDEVLGHKRRYTKSTLRRVARAAGLEIGSLKYAFSFLVVPAYVVRRVLPEKPHETGRTDLSLPHPIVNAVLCALGGLEAFLGGNPIAGTSVIGAFTVPGTSR
jgi:SAM-dependent methyltransferase